MDIVSTARADQTVSLYLNQGAGVFAPAVTLATPGAQRELVLADLDGDSRIDIVMLGGAPSEIAWLRNLGLGSFAAPASLVTGMTSPLDIDVADLNGDGRPDLLTSTNAYPAGMVWYEGLGGGSFGPQRDLDRSPGRPGQAVAADLDSDGDVDVLAGKLGPVSIGWFENDGAGHFALRQVVSSNIETVSALCVADLTNDGHLDVAAGIGPDAAIAVILNRTDSWSSFCEALPNSTGSEARLSASGSHAAAAGSLTLSANAVPDQLGLFVHGTNPARTSFGNGYRCVSDSLARGSLLTAVGQQASYTYDNSDALHSLAPFVGGMRYFQYWYRDPQGGGSLFNTSDGIRLIVLP